MENPFVFAMVVSTILAIMTVRGEDCSKNNTKTQEQYLISNARKAQNAKKCDLYAGRWVYDNSYPLYDAGECPFIEKQFNCETNGRYDKDYLKFSWKPFHCFLPRFDGVDFLEKLKGKKIMFVGDSISLNQWQSLVCLLHTTTPNALYAITRSGGFSEVKFLEYNASLMLMRDAFLVKVVRYKKLGKILNLNMVSHGESWKGINVLIFNTWHWWLHKGRKQVWDYIKDGRKLYQEMDRLVAYEKGLRTWARWVDKNLDTTRSKVYFQGVSPDHMRGAHGKVPKPRTCVGETKPGPNLMTHVQSGERILEKVIGEMRKPVHLLRINRMSQLRRDGHPGIYGIGRHRLPDCTHWCLPGVPDTWNHLLYASLFNYTHSV
ncbi:protein trichome birefringence-like 43 [Silene latifolia]|uniref:protein trichome birefringence-like 43 n=1 Tax=Silene latifolia TaxID=37657 RepID=UPI003D77BA99